ncbi:GcrA family cell cycle regulator [Algimonas porphyrae]|uniref:Cell cycle regulatory protein GcrA n=1 Tax=Algimonas porphyrae TaxID=1128113 RepID=A0ABQ5V1X4_9PROT|nr:GcrA family cell cycle regulator [Algimonas porphyrae]GLQ21559.1 cell cycle regulatory protein GcrA [Algimonas porphyrae]
MAWTEDRVATLSKLWAEGLSASQIAKQLGGVTRNAVIGKVHRLGLSGRAKPSRPKPAKTQTTARATPKPKPAKAQPATRRSAAKPKAQPSSLPVSTEPPLEAKPLKDGSYATILTLTDHMCKFPIGDPSADEFRFCGRKTDPDEPYCTPHSMVAYQPSRRRNSSGKMISIGPAPTSRKRLR